MSNSVIANFDFRDIFASTSSFLLRDFNEIKFLQFSDKMARKNFAIASYKKGYEVLIKSLFKTGIRCDVVFPNNIYLEKEIYNIGNEIRSADGKIKNVYFRDNVCFYKEKDAESVQNTTRTPQRILISIDGIDHFERGLPMYSISLCYQTKHSEKYNTNYAITYECSSGDVFFADNTGRVELNGTKINNKNNILISKPNLDDVCICNSNVVMQGLSNSIVLYNSNLALSYVASGRAGSFFCDYVASENDFISGLFFAMQAGLKVVTAKNDKGLPVIIAGNEVVVNGIISQLKS
ncbi:MAG: hypothetical protein RL208_460 [Pseudomonadota bacterium]|jgi:fructose-1,6-bisphosphatase/inositol monophosphatase family enzyme